MSAQHTPVLLHNWSGGTVADVFKDFDGERWSYYSENEEPTPVEEKPKFIGAEVLFASYGTDNYSGDAFVLFRRDGKLFEVNGSHCSCYGLEGQWDPEETTVAALRHRLTDGRLGQDDYSDNVFADDLARLLDTLDAKADGRAS